MQAAGTELSKVTIDWKLKWAELLSGTPIKTTLPKPRYKKHHLLFEIYHNVKYSSFRDKNLCSVETWILIFWTKNFFVYVTYPNWIRTIMALRNIRSFVMKFCCFCLLIPVVHLHKFVREVTRWSSMSFFPLQYDI